MLYNKSHVTNHSSSLSPQTDICSLSCYLICRMLSWFRFTVGFLFSTISFLPSAQTFSFCLKSPVLCSEALFQVTMDNSDNPGRWCISYLGPSTCKSTGHQQHLCNGHSLEQSFLSLSSWFLLSSALPQSFASGCSIAVPSSFLVGCRLETGGWGTWYSLC